MWGFHLFISIFSKAFDAISHNRLQDTARHVHNIMGEQLAEELGSKSCNKWGSIWLAASH